MDINMDSDYDKEEYDKIDHEELDSNIDMNGDSDYVPSNRSDVSSDTSDEESDYINMGSTGVKFPDDAVVTSSTDIQEIVNNSEDSLSYQYPIAEVPDISAFKDSSQSLEPNVSIYQKTSKKKWDKKHSCKFCQKLVTKMSTHLTLCHKTESEVAYVLNLKKGSKERRQAWGKLLNEGDYCFNYAVLESGKGKLIPKYRGSNNNVDDYVVCSHCKALYNKSLLYQHNQNCFMRTDSVKSKKGHPVKDGKLSMPVPKNISHTFYEKIILKMKKDEIFNLLQNDTLIILYGERSFYRKDLEEHTPNIVSGRMRELGRLLQCLRRKTEMRISTLTQALHPSNFNTVLQCVRELADFDEDTNSFKKGSVAMRLGHTLKKCASIVKSEAIKNDDKDLEKVAESFDSLFSGDWHDYVSATAAQSIYRAKANRPKLLPVISDIEKLHKLLGEKMISSDYSILSRATLCSITLFNRKRGGEVQRLKTEDFDRGIQNGSISDPVLLNGLSDAEKKMISFFHRIEIRGKFNRVVPILLTETMLSCLKTLKQLRMKMNPPITSPYFFCTKTGERPYRGVDVIKEFAKEACVSDLSVFTFTTLRKHVATLTQSIEISKLDQDQLASFLGHDIRIHRSFYRRPIDIVEKAKVAKILLAANKGINLPWDKIGHDEVDEELEEDEQESHFSEEDPTELFEENPIEMCPEDKGEEMECESSLTDPDSMVIEHFEISCKSEMMPNPKNVLQNSKEKKFTRKVWSVAEIEAVKRQLNHCIVTNTIPRKNDAVKAITSEPDLRRRSWKNVKDYIYNIIKKQQSAHA